MARTRAFDRADVLDRAMTLFWEHGFSETSMQMLVTHMGICRSSLYETFSSKEDLYREAIDLYVTRSLDTIGSLLRAEASPRRSISSLFESELEALLRSETPTCLLLRTAVARCRGCPETSEKVRDWLSRLVALFEKRLEEAQSAGEVAADFDTDGVAHHLVNTLLGLKAQGGIPAGRASLDATIRTALRALGPTNDDL